MSIVEAVQHLKSFLPTRALSMATFSLLFHYLHLTFLAKHNSCPGGAAEVAGSLCFEAHFGLLAIFCSGRCEGIVKSLVCQYLEVG
jgi:hypothetical protein